MNSSSRRYLSSWPRNTTTAPLQVTILMYCTKGQQRRRSSGTVATPAPARIILVTPQVTFPMHLRVKRQSITIEGCKSSIFVDDARNVCKETFSCSVLMWASTGFPESCWVYKLCKSKWATLSICLGVGPVMISLRQMLNDQLI